MQLLLYIYVVLHGLSSTINFIWQDRKISIIYPFYTSMCMPIFHWHIDFFFKMLSFWSPVALTMDPWIPPAVWCGYAHRKGLSWRSIRLYQCGCFLHQWVANDGVRKVLYPTKLQLSGKTKICQSSLYKFQFSVCCLACIWNMSYMCGKLNAYEIFFK